MDMGQFSVYSRSLESLNNLDRELITRKKVELMPLRECHVCISYYGCAICHTPTSHTALINNTSALFVVGVTVSFSTKQSSGNDLLTDDCYKTTLTIHKEKSMKSLHKFRENVQKSASR